MNKCLGGVKVPLLFPMNVKKSKIWSPIGLEVEETSKGDREAKDPCVLKLDLRCNHTHHVLKMEFEISTTVYNYSF